MVKKNEQLQEWNRQIEEQRTSDLNIQEWCIQNGINPKTYYYHLCKVRKEFMRSGKSEKAQAQIETERAVVPILTASSGGNITIEKNELCITLPGNITSHLRY